MKTIRLLYPDSVSGGLSTYRLGARLMAAMLPENDAQPLVKIDVPALGDVDPAVTNGIVSEAAVLDGIRKAQTALEAERFAKVFEDLPFSPTAPERDRPLARNDRTTGAR